MPSASSTNDSQHFNNSPDASPATTALRGASLAFQRNKSPISSSKVESGFFPIPPTDSKSLQNSSAETLRIERPYRLLSSPGPQHTSIRRYGDELAHHRSHSTGENPADMAPIISGYSSATSPQVNGMSKTPGIDIKNPSFIAATLAASRSASPSPSISVTPSARKVGSPGSSLSRVGQEVDSVPLAPMGSLISMFENGATTRRRRSDSTDDISPERVSDESIEDLTDIESVPRLPPPLSTCKPRVQSKRLVSPRRRATEDEDPNRSLVRGQTVILRHSSRASSRASSRRTLRSPIRGTSIARAVSPRRSPRTALSPKIQSRISKSQPIVGTYTLEEMPVEKSPQSNPISTARTKSPVSVSYIQPRPKPNLRPITPPAIIRQSTPDIVSPTPWRPTNPAVEAATSPEIALRAPRRMSPPSVDPEKRSPLQKSILPTPPLPRDMRDVVGQRPSVATKSSQMMIGRPQRSGTVSSNDTFVSASSAPADERWSSTPPPLQRIQSPRTPTWRTNQETIRPRWKNPSTSSLTLNHLTNAIVAGSLASSRLTPQHSGPTLAPPSLPPRQRSPRLMRTLRHHQESPEIDTNHHKRGRLPQRLKKGKHAHHEGSRKKWREEITERERKRYEAVWQSNRGLHVSETLPPPRPSASPSPSRARRSPTGVSNRDPSEYVISIVVREVWKRSRLPDDELAEVWDLVDREKRGLLHKQEFVVGMWLIDQRLKGRKIPHKVTDSVWGSANGMTMIMRPRTR